MPIYPGDPAPSFERAATLEKNGVNLTRMTLGSHTGTHTDAPIHFIEDGIPVDRIPVSDFFGEALVIDLSGKKPIGSGIVAADLEPYGGAIKNDDIVLLYTGSSDQWGNPSTNSNYTYLTGDCCEYLARKKVRAVGIDFLSVEQFKAKEPVAHKMLLSHNIFIIESLSNALRQFSGQRILFVCLPIKLQNGDGAPSRAIAIPIVEE